MTGSAGFVLTATAQATATFFATGAAGVTFGASATLTAVAELTGTADFTLSATGELINGGSAVGDMSGAASFTFSATGLLTDANVVVTLVTDWVEYFKQSTAQQPQAKKRLVKLTNREYDADITRQELIRQRQIEEEDEIILALCAQFVTGTA